MPTYDYRCDHCGHAFHARQSFDDEPLKVCPSCGKEPRRIVSASSIVFKGSGWYKTDSRAKTTGSSNGAAASASDTKTETKTGTKTETKKDSPAPSDKKTSSSSG